MKKFIRKKGLVLACILILAFSLIACGGTGVSSKTDEDNSNNQVNNNSNENEEVEEMDEEEVQEVEEDTVLDSALAGIELLASFKAVSPKTLFYESEMNSPQMVVKTITYIDGSNTRTETDMGDFGTSISISLADEDVMYSYQKGSSEGTKISGMNSEENLEMDDLFDDAEFLASVTDESSEDVIARVEMLDGEEVVYIESTEAEDDMGEALVKMWYSVKYAIPLKYEMYMEDELIVSYMVTSVDKNMKMDKDLFTPPSDVEFYEANMDALFDSDLFEDME